MILKVDGLGIQPFRTITPNNGFLYNKAEVDDLLDSKEPRLITGGRAFNTNIPSGWTVAPFLMNYTSANQQSHVVRALAVGSSSKLQLLWSDSAGFVQLIDDDIQSDIQANAYAISNCYTKSQTDLRYRLASDSIGFSQVTGLGQLFSAAGGSGYVLNPSALGASAINSLKSSFASSITLSPQTAIAGIYIVDAQSNSYPIGGGSNITVGQDPTDKGISISLRDSINLGSITTTGTVATPAITLNGSDLQAQLNSKASIYAIPRTTATAGGITSDITGRPTTTPPTATS